MREDADFDSGSARCAAWRFRCPSEALADAGGRPCVVMAGGLGATRDCGFDVWARRLAEAGVDVLVFDYRGFGDSAGEPRQLVDLAGQRADFHAAIAHARALDGIDSARIALCGHSLSGGHVLQVAVEDGRVAAVIAVAPAADARASLALAIAGNGIRTTALAMLAGARDAIAARRGRPAVRIPIVADRGQAAAFTSEYARRTITDTAGPAWHNELAARIILSIGFYRPITLAGRLRCPTLVQVADEDTMAAPQAAIDAAWRARAEVRHYPCDHNDVLVGGPWFDAATDHQIQFLRRHLASRALAADRELAA